MSQLLDNNSDENRGFDRLGDRIEPFQKKQKQNNVSHLESGYYSS